MPIMFRFSSFFLTSLFAAALAGCATMDAVKQQVSPAEQADFSNEFSATNVYTRSFPGTAAETCEAARRALLSQGYVIHEASASLVRGRKNFQPQNEVHVQVEFNVVCAENSKGSNSTTAFANAVRDRYTLKKSSNSASLGVGVLGSVSLPFGYTEDALVKVASETIPNRRFYDRFFETVDAYLDYGSRAYDEREPKPAGAKPLDSEADLDS